MRLVGEADPDEEMVSVVTSLELERDPLHLPRALAQENPVVLEGIPEVLNGREIEVQVRTGGVYVGGPAKLVVQEGERSEVEVVFGERTHSGSLSVEVLDGLNRPQADAKVFLRGTLETYPATTDKLGRAKFEGIAPESYSLSVGETDGWELSKIVVHEVERLFRRFALGRATIRGRVVLGGGKEEAPPCDVKVRALGERSASVMAEKDGTFEISGALPGKYSLFATSSDQKRFSEKTEVLVPHVGGPKDIELRLVEGGRVKFIVGTSEGKPVTGVKVFHLGDDGQREEL